MEPEERSLAGLFMSFQSRVEIPGPWSRVGYTERIDSGLDVDALQDVAKAVNGLLTPQNSVLMITHYQRLLDFIKPTLIHIMENGRIIKTGDNFLAKLLEEEVYKAIYG